MLPALPTGMARTSGAPPRSSQTSKAAVCLALQPVRVDRVHEGDRVLVLLGELAHGREGGVEVAAHGEHPRPGGLGLEELAGGDLAGRQDDDDLQPGGRPVGRGGGGRVARRGADDGARARLEGLRDGHHHAPVLERPGRVGALELQVEVRDPPGLAEALRVHEGRGALAQREAGRGGGDGQVTRVAVEEARPRGRRGRRRARQVDSRPPVARSPPSVGDRVERDVDAVGEVRRDRRPDPLQGQRPRSDGRPAVDLLHRGRLADAPPRGARCRAGRRTTAGLRRTGPRCSRAAASRPRARARPTCCRRGARSRAGRRGRRCWWGRRRPPGPRRRRCRPARPATSTRFSTPSVPPRAPLSGTAVGRTVAASDPAGPGSATARSLRSRPRKTAPSISSEVTPVMPGLPQPRTDGGVRRTLPGSSHDPNARRARRTSLLTASSPSTSPRGSASA